MEGIYIMKKGSKKFSRLDSHTMQNSGEVFTDVKDILQFNENACLIISHNDLCLIENVSSILPDSIPDISLLHFTREKLKDGQPAISLSVDHKRNYLVATKDNFYKINRDEKSGVIHFEPFNFNQSRFTSYKNLVTNNFTDDDIDLIYKDTQDNLWISTFNGGFYKIQPGNNKKVRHYNLTSPKDRIISMHEVSPGYFLLGLNNGILKFNSEAENSVIR